jgi:putative tryptophan/tyrosine transport system substrate-binding protein
MKSERPRLLSVKNVPFWTTVTSMLIALCLTAEAQQKIPVIGYLAGSSAPTISLPDVNGDAFRQGLRDLGYVDGKNIRLIYRYADGNEDRVQKLVTELLQLKVDALVTPYRPVILAAKQVTTTIPIIMVTTRDPVADGFVQSMSRPGGNITGITRLTRDLSGKLLEVLQEIIPTISRAGVLLNAESATARTMFKEYETAARSLKIKVRLLVRSSKLDLEEVFRTAVNDRLTALIAVRSPVLIDNRQRIAELAIQNRMASFSEGSIYVEAGGLASYSSGEVDLFKRAAVYVDKILKGAKPADLPIEQPTKFELVINLKTAKQIGLSIPPSVLTSG